MNEFIAEIEEIGFGGEGVCHKNGKTCFVKYVLPKEIVSVGITQEKSNFDNGKINFIKKESDQRVKPLCPYFSICGGCDFQHTNYENEILIKKNILEKQLLKIGYKIDVKVNASENDYFYRNKIRLFPGEKSLGYKKERTDEIVEVDSCKIANKLINNNIEIISNFIYQNKIQRDIKYIEIKSKNEKLLINLFLKNKVKYDITELRNQIKCEFGLFETYNKKTRSVYGIKDIIMFENKINYKTTANSFMQINDNIAEKIYGKVLNYVKEKNVINCYSGAGLLSALICKNGAKKVVGIELGKSEHADAESLKQENNLKNLENIYGDCSKVLPVVTKNSKDIDLIIIDPPRKGCSEAVCESLNNSNVNKIIYISCNNATYVRDIQKLLNYSIADIELYDMFPRTANFEIFSILQKN